MSVSTYSARQVTISVGNHIVTGVADDSFITIEPLGEGTSAMSGCYGEVVRSVDPNNMFTVKIVLLQNSKTNKYLTDMYKRDQKDANGIEPVLVKDIKGGQQFASSTAWIAKPASMARGKAAGTREWELQCADGELTES